MSTQQIFTDNPADQINRAFLRIEQNQMQGLPVCNPELTSEIVGLTRFGGYWLGALVTPWTLQLIMVAAEAGVEVLEAGDHRIHQFPQGEVMFMASENPDIGLYQSCSLLSPLHDFPNQAAIRQTSGEVVELLFQSPVQKKGQSVEVALPGRLDVERESKPVQETHGSRRDFLRGRMK